MSMAEIIEQTRVEAAQAAWSKAKLASKLRHKSRREVSRNILADIKANCIKRALALAPECMRVGVDRHYLVGVPSFQWVGMGKLHQPNAAK